MLRKCTARTIDCIRVGMLIDVSRMKRKISYSVLLINYLYKSNIDLHILFLFSTQEFPYSSTSNSCGQEAPLKYLSLRDLMPDTPLYMTYEGSTTMPGCYETVTWIVMNKPIYITKQQNN
ncbi:UNVERIFIED_CONTAM: Carbonic anhydrase-related protein 10 [Trichonephila clavipes]